MQKITTDGRGRELQDGVMRMFCHISRRHKLTVMEVMITEVMMDLCMSQDMKQNLNFTRLG